MKTCNIMKVMFIIVILNLKYRCCTAGRGRASIRIIFLLVVAVVCRLNREHVLFMWSFVGIAVVTSSDLLVCRICGNTVVM